MTTSKYKHDILIPAVPISLRIDYIFSYWIIAVFILYELGWIKYSPKLLLFAGLLENIGSIALLFFYSVSWLTIFIFIINTFLIKVLPLIIVWKDRIKREDVYFSIGIFLLYNIWIQINNINIFQFYNLIMDSIIHERNETPFFWTLKKLNINRF